MGAKGIPLNAVSANIFGIIVSSVSLYVPHTSLGPQLQEWLVTERLAVQPKLSMSLGLLYTWEQSTIGGHGQTKLQVRIVNRFQLF